MIINRSGWVLFATMHINLPEHAFKAITLWSERGLPASVDRGGSKGSERAVWRLESLGTGKSA